jgi:hypothetical protein
VKKRILADHCIHTNIFVFILLKIQQKKKCTSIVTFIYIHYLQVLTESVTESGLRTLWAKIAINHCNMSHMKRGGVRFLLINKIHMLSVAPAALRNSNLCVEGGGRGPLT